MQLKDQRKGTLMLVAQPAEEIITGAKAMVNDDLYTRFPKPDYLKPVRNSDAQKMSAKRPPMTRMRRIFAASVLAAEPR